MYRTSTVVAPKTGSLSELRSCLGNLTDEDSIKQVDCRKAADTIRLEAVVVAETKRGANRVLGSAVRSVLKSADVDAEVIARCFRAFIDEV